MKVLKILGFVVGGLMLIALILVALAFTSPVQTWAVRRAVAGMPGAQVEVGKVSAGLSGAEVQNFRYTKDGMVVTAPALSIRGSALDFVTSDKVDIQDVTARDLVIDLRNAKPAPEAADAKGGFSGGFKLVQLPFDVTVGKVAVSGRALMPANRTVVFTVDGGGIRTGAEGRIDLKADFADATPGAALAAAHAEASATVHIAADRRLDALKIDATGTLQGPKLPSEKFQAVISGSQATAGADENYRVEFGLSRPTGMERILGASAVYRPTAGEFAGDWNIALRTEQLAAVLTGLGLPPLAVSGSGKADYSVQRKSGGTSGELTVDVSGLDRIAPALAALPNAKLRTAFDLGVTESLARLERGQVEVLTPEGRKLAEATVLQKVAYDFKGKTLANFDANADVARVSLQQVPLAWAQPFLPAGFKVDAGDLSAAFSVQASADGAKIVARSVQPVAIRETTLRQGERALLTRASLGMSPKLEYTRGGAIAAEIADLNLASPDGDSLTGRATVNLSGSGGTAVTAFTASLRGRAAGASLSLVPVQTGPLAVSVEIDGRSGAQALQLQKMDMEIRREGGAVLASAKASQPLRVNFKEAKLAVDNPGSAAAVVQLGEFPLAWVQPFVKGSQIAGVASGGSIEVLAESNDALGVRSTAPISVKGLSFAMDGKNHLRNLDLVTDFAVSQKGKGYAYELKSLEAQEAGKTILKMQSAGEISTAPAFSFTGKGSLEVDAAALGRQPALGMLSSLARGNITASFDAAKGAETKVDAKVSARNLLLRDGGRDAGNLDATVALVAKADGSATARLPLVLVVGGRKTDILLDGTVSAATAAGVRNVNGRITGEQLVVDDLMALAAIGRTAPAPAPTQAPAPAQSGAARPAGTAPAPVVADTAPFWKAVAGKITTDIKQVRYGTNHVITGVRGNLAITDTKLSIDGFEGRYGTDPYTLTGAITFTPRQARPYALTGKANVSNLDLGAILRAANPAEPPAIESKMNVAANLGGTGRNAADLIQSITGKFDVSGGTGVLRALGRKGQAVGTVSTIVGILGAIQGSDTTSAIGTLGNELREMRFEQFKLSAERAADLSLKVSGIEVISPVFRLTGSGTIEHRNDGPITQQPMSMQLRFGTKDQMAFLFNRAGLLQEKVDDKGYTLLSRDFTISGTPAKPDSSEFWRFITEAVARAATGLLNKYAQ